MADLRAICEFLGEFAPTQLAEEWDNVGLLVGDPNASIARVMTCLTITPASVAEAIAEHADLIVTHHPLPFRPLKRLTTETVPGDLLWRLIRGGIAVYSPHTAFDSASRGINQLLAEGIGLTNIQPLVACDDADKTIGSGRFGQFPLPTSLSDVAGRLKEFLHIEGLHRVGDAAKPVRCAAVACGSAGQFLAAAVKAECDLLVTGETSFHTCLEAEAAGVALLLPGHFASERFAVERLADVIAHQFSSLQIWASRREADPLVWM